MSSTISKLSRRDFLKAGLAVSSGLTLGLRVGPAPADEVMPFMPNAFVRIGADDAVTIIAKHVEMGQGIHTGLATLLAEELDADWAQIRVEAAPADGSRYDNLNWGGNQGTGGSSSINNSWLQMREAGATARAMLVATARLPIPTPVKLKEAQDFVYIGRPLARTDGVAKTHGQALYTIDLRLPGMRTAVMLHPPRFGAIPAQVDDTAARAIKGVHAVLQLAEGVAVVAENFWAAARGREALKVEWDESRAITLDSQAQRAQYRELADSAGHSLRADGDAAGAFATPHKLVEAVYELPYLAHAALEPMNCIAQINKTGCELWYGAQSMTSAQNHVAHLLGIAPAQVKINQLFAGGSFGRRADMRADYVLETVRIAQALGDGQPLKLLWTREDDMRGGRYRPAATALRGAVDAQGEVQAWQQRIVCQALRGGGVPKDGKVDKTLHEGASDLPYRISNLAVDVHIPEPGVPVLWWRSVGHTHTAFAVESFIDELAHAAARDPLELRRSLLRDDPQRLAVLELAAAKGDWGRPLAKRRGRGIAVHRSFGTWVAEVVEVKLGDAESFTVERVTVAVDCGIAVNPDVVRAQMEGSVGYALSAALSGEITFKNGAVVQGNFDNYPLLRLSQKPAIDVHIVPSSAAPSGVGEPGVPPLAPALANALFAATGKRWRTLPFRTPSAA